MAIESSEIDGVWYGTMMDLVREIFENLVPLRPKEATSGEEETTSQDGEGWIPGDTAGGSLSTTGNGTGAGGTGLQTEELDTTEGSGLTIRGYLEGDVVEVFGSEDSGAYRHAKEYIGEGFEDEDNTLIPG